MNIRRLDLFAFDLPLVRPLSVGGKPCRRRRGIVLALTGDSLETGYGEIAPLPGWDQVTLDDCRQELRLLSTLLPGMEISMDDFALTSPWLGCFSLPGRWNPLVRFGLECALLDLCLKRVDTPAREMLSILPDPLEIQVNGLFFPSPETAVFSAQADHLRRAGFKTIKAKIGRLPIGIETGQILTLARSLAPDTIFRLDGNQNLSPGDYGVYFEKLEELNVEYVEEPVNDLSSVAHIPWPLAVDESLRSYAGADESAAPLLPPFVRAVILKPGALPGISGMLRLAKKRGMKTVFSSAFNTGLMIPLLGLLSVLAGAETAQGLDTLQFLAADVAVDPPDVASGALFIPRSCFSDERKINPNLLKRVEP